MAEYKHGVFTQEAPTTLITPVTSSANILFMVGIAPINLGDETNVNKLQRLSTPTEAKQLFGYSTNYADYTLSEAFNVIFNLYKIAPVYWVNVLDCKKHKVAVLAETQPVVNNQVVLTQKGAIKSSVLVTVADKEGKDTKDKANLKAAIDTDYTLAFGDDERLILSIVPGGSIKPDATLTINYDKLDPGKVTKKDIIGGIDANDNYSGIALANKVFPQFNDILGSLIAPGYSNDTEVALALTATAKTLNTKFTANSIIDLDTSAIKTYTDAVAIKQKAGLTDPFMNLCVGDVTLSGVVYHQSLHLAALKQQLAGNNGSVPNLNPSNKRYLIDGYQINGVDKYLDDDQAGFLNKNGMIVAINGSSGWKCWGNRTAAFPGSTDIKDVDIAVRDMFSWTENQITDTSREFIDGQLRQRDINRFLNSIQHWLDGLVQQEYLIKADFSFPKELNPQADLIAGISRYNLKMTVAPANTEISVTLEYDVNGLNLLFSK